MSFAQTSKRGAFTLHFVSAGTEFQYSDKELKVGDKMVHDGGVWAVVDVGDKVADNTLVTLRPVDGT